MTEKTLAQILAKAKAMGKAGAKLPDIPRIPTGAFPLDLGLGGGLPSCRATMIFGSDGSGRSNVALRVIATHQHLYPKRTCAYIAMEGFDPAWATLLGVDMEKLSLVTPSDGEQAIEMLESLLHAEDCGVVVVDTLATMVSKVNSAEVASAAANSVLVDRLVKRASAALATAEQAGRNPALIFLNPIRLKAGTMLPDLKKFAGGQAPASMSALIIQLYGKDKLDPNVSQAMPVLKDTTFLVKKSEMPIFSRTGRFEMVLVPHEGLQPGECDDWNTVAVYLKKYSQLKKSKKGWHVLGEEFPELDDFRERLYSDKEFGAEVRSVVIERGRKEEIMGIVVMEDYKPKPKALTKAVTKPASPMGVPATPEEIGETPDVSLPQSATKPIDPDNISTTKEETAALHGIKPGQALNPPASQEQSEFPAASSLPPQSPQKKWVLRKKPVDPSFATQAARRPHKAFQSSAER